MRRRRRPEADPSPDFDAQAERLGGLLAGATTEDAVRALGALVAQLPDEAVMEFASAFEVARPIDYAPHDVRLVLTSKFIRFRLQAASKEPFTVEWIEARVRPGDVLYDIGANVGPYSLIAAKHTGGEARVYAFEPSAGSYHDLCRNIVLNGCEDAVVPFCVALWSETALTVFHQRTLAAGAARHVLSGGASDRKARYHEPLLAYALDDLIERFDLPLPNHVKVDVDGPELQVLQGASRTLRRPEWRSLLIEVERDDDAAEQAISELAIEAGFALVCRHERGPKAPAYLSFEKPDGPGTPP